MSYSAMYKIPVKGEIETFAEYSNSHGFCSYIWDMMIQKYGLGTSFMMYAMENRGTEWDFFNSGALERHEQLVMESTFDLAVVPKEMLQELADAYRKFYEETKALGHDRVCHLPKIANDLEKVLKKNSYGVCFWGTSISDDLWYEWGGEDEEGESIPFDISTADRDKYFLVGRT